MEKGIIHFPGHWKEYKQAQIVTAFPLRTLWSTTGVAQGYYSGLLYLYSV